MRKLCMVLCHSYEISNLRDLEEQISEEEGGFKVIIWGWHTTKGMRVDVTSSLALLG